MNTCERCRKLFFRGYGTRRFCSTVCYRSSDLVKRKRVPMQKVCKANDIRTCPVCRCTFCRRPKVSAAVWSKRTVCSVKCLGESKKLAATVNQADYAGKPEEVMTYTEVASRLNMSVRQVQRIEHRALRKLAAAARGSMFLREALGL